MMECTLTIDDRAPEELVGEHYDLALFASGYEARCTYVPRMFERTRIDSITVLGFAAVRDSEQRQENDRYFENQWSSRPIVLSADDEEDLYPVLQSLAQSPKRELRILVDYSSMSRLWYAGLINWARFSVATHRIVVDFVYSVGRYGKTDRSIVIDAILPLPGCEGGALRFGTSTAVFGLGFWGEMAECVLEDLEPDRVYSFLASPGAIPEYRALVMEGNESIIQHSHAVLEIPLFSVSAAVQHLSELVTPYRRSDEIVFVPMGPKPHVLASVLVATRFREVSCLRVSAQRQRPESIEASGDVIATRVEFVAPKRALHGTFDPHPGTSTGKHEG